jgi:hypothetical protein
MFFKVLYSTILYETLSINITGKNLVTPGYKTLKEQLLQSGDVLVIKELDCLGRTNAIWRFNQQLQEATCNIKRAVIQQPFLHNGGGEGTCSSNVSIGTDYILNLGFFPSPPAYYGSYIIGVYYS